MFDLKLTRMDIVIIIDISNNYCETGILPVLERLFGRCLFNIGDREAHLTLVPIGQIFRRFANGVATAEFAATPARLTSARG